MAGCSKSQGRKPGKSAGGAAAPATCGGPPPPASCGGPPPPSCGAPPPASCGSLPPAPCGGAAAKPAAGDPCRSPSPSPCGGPPHAAPPGVAARFERMIANCLDYARREHAAGRPLVGIMCEYTPRELIFAAGALPVCLCGGSAATIPAAEEVLPANLCPLIKSTYGYHAQRSNPFLEMAALLVAETTCDGKKKMYELLARERPMHVLELPQKAGDPDAFAHWLQEVRKLKAALERRFKTKITAAKLRAGIALMNRERALRRKLGDVMRAANPPLTGLELLRLQSSVSGIPEDLAEYERLLKDLRGRSGPPGREQAVRVLMTGVPQPHGAHRVLEIVEQRGGLVVALESCSGLKPILDDVDEKAPDPLKAIAEKYFHLPCSVMTPNEERLKLLARLAKRYRAECVIELIWQACLTYDVETALVKKFVEEKLGLPYLRLETDYSPSDSARIAVRVEALAETVRGKRQK